MRKLIRVDGTETELEKRQSLRDIKKLIGCDTIDTVIMHDRVHVMIVDDVGMIDDKQINEKATSLYREVCRPGTVHCIHGDVVIVPDDDFA